MASIGYSKQSAPVRYSNTSIAHRKSVRKSDGLIQSETDINFSTQQGTFIPDSLSGFRLTDYKSRIANGTNATTPFDAFERELVSYDVGSYDCSVATSVSSVINKYTGFDFAFGLPDLFLKNADESKLSSVLNSANQRVYQQLSSDFKGLTFLAEFREAVHMLKHPALALRLRFDSYIRAVKKRREIALRSPGNLKKKNQTRKAIAETWLEYSFGWKPLLNDITEGVDAINRLSTKREFHPFKALAEERFKTSQYVGYVKHIDPFRIHYAILGDHHNSVSIVGSAIDTLSGTTAGELGLLPEEFLPTAWELAPWSFVIDYFTNIGSVLDAYATAQRTGFGFVSTTSRCISSYSLDYGWDLDTTGSNYSIKTMDSFTKGSIVFTVKHVLRQPSASVQLPYFASDVKLSTPKGLNLAALAILMFSDRKRPVGYP